MAYTVKEVPRVWITVADGTRLAAALWVPTADSDATSTRETFPAILEFLPYRVSDSTVARDMLRLSWFCSHGYVCVRVDMRGSGNSEGFYYDEYEKQEQDDCCDVIKWISEQDWCTGAVGMFGKSWGGFNGLQVASRQPPALKAVVSVYSTDERYDGDFHHRGGCVVADGVLSWGTFMFQRNAYPHHPRIVGTRWKELWLERLQNAFHPFTHAWLAHQTRDDYWKHGSVCEDYSLMRCPILLVGGWSDMYTETIFRMAEHHKGPLKCICGPWDHSYPDESLMGPRIDFLRECLRWWDHHLKRVPNDVMDEPKLRLYMEDGIPAAADVSEWPGRWFLEDSWPSPNVSNTRFQLTVSGKLEPHNVTMKTEETKTNVIQTSVNALQGHTSPNAGFWGESVLPTDQRLENGLSACWVTEPLVESMTLLGRAELQLELSCDQPQGIVAVRLCDVFPDGKSTLISRGFLNLTHRNGHSKEDVSKLIPGKIYNVKVKLDARAYVVTTGHKLLLAVSPSSWPLIWPSPEPTTLSIHPCQRSSLVVPVRVESRAVKEKDLALKSFGPPQLSSPSHVQRIREPAFSRIFTTDQVTGLHTLTMTRDRGLEFHTKTGTTLGEKFTQVFTVTEDKPHSPKINIKGNTTFIVTPSTEPPNKEDDLPDPSASCDVRLEYETEMTSDKKYFHLTHHIRALDGKEICFEKSWNKDIERFCV